MIQASRKTNVRANEEKTVDFSQLHCENRN